MSEFRIKRVQLVAGVGGFWVNDQPAIQTGATADGFFFNGRPVSPGFSAIREPSTAYCVMLELEDGQIAYGDCVTVLNLGYGGRPLPLKQEDMPAVQNALAELFVGQAFTSFRSAAQALEAPEFRNVINRPVAYGVSQALLSAAALSQHTTMASVLMDEYGIDRYMRPGLAGSCGGEWHLNVDKAIVRAVNMFPQSAIQTRGQCEQLPEYSSWIRQRIEKLGSRDYQPDLHFDFHSSLGRLFDNDLDRVCRYLADIVERTSPYRVYFEDPLFATTATEAIDNMARLRERLGALGIPCRLVADEWANAPGEIENYAKAGAAHAIQIKAPDNGSLTTIIDAIQICKKQGVLPYLGGSCNETDISVRATVNIGVALGVWRLFTRPGLGFDEGLMVTTNELNRTLALLRAQRPTQYCSNPDWAAM